MMLESRVIAGGTWEGKKVSFLVEGLAFIGTGKLLVTQMFPHL